jgi:long-chain acyl-CoA synthetase
MTGPLDLRATDRPALHLEDGTSVTHRTLLRLADRFARRLPHDRKSLVVLLGDRELGTVAAYLGALRAGHTVGWFGSAHDGVQQANLLEAYRPEVIVTPETADAGLGRLAMRPSGTPIAGMHILELPGPRAPGDIHPRTDLLLLTSGSVSGGRTVRLSADALTANGTAIRDVLGLDGANRGATSLPLYYTYGLSVMNSHLLAGGSVLLSAAPVGSRRFWRYFHDAGCELFAGVPTQLEWLARAQLPWADIAALRKVTVAGGRLRTPLARRFHQACDASGRQFYKMYGQTEATARITILRHDDFPGREDSVGRVLPGGRLTVAGSAATPAEVIYHGPSVMQGYADTRADLARGDEMRGTINTGDQGYLEEGFLYLTGRAGRFVKPLGRRVSLDALEDLFAEAGVVGAVGDRNERAHVFVAGGPDTTTTTERLRSNAVTRMALPLEALHVHHLPLLPLLPSGKVDYRRLAALVPVLRGG